MSFAEWMMNWFLNRYKRNSIRLISSIDRDRIVFVYKIKRDQSETEKIKTRN